MCTRLSETVASAGRVDECHALVDAAEVLKAHRAQQVVQRTPGAQASRQCCTRHIEVPHCELVQALRTARSTISGLVFVSCGYAALAGRQLTLLAALKHAAQGGSPHGGVTQAGFAPHHCGAHAWSNATIVMVQVRGHHEFVMALGRAGVV